MASSSSPSKGNVKNPAIRRIHADIRELQKDPSDQYTAAPLEENLFEWHFTLRGPPGTDFAGGIYHGRILLPAEYPFKPPNIMLLTSNGRFEVGKKICLSISAHHPEHWQPAWGVRLILEALISFFPTDPKGAVGSLDWTPQERRRLAAESQSYCCARCGLAKALLPEPKPPASSSSEAGEEQQGDGEQPQQQPPAPSRYAEEIAQLYVRGASASDASASDAAAAVAAAATDASAMDASASASTSSASPSAPLPATSATAATASSSASSSSGTGLDESAGLRRRAVPPSAPEAAATATGPPQPPQGRPQELARPTPAPVPAVHINGRRPLAQDAREEEAEAEDKLLYIAIGLALLIALLVGRKVLRAMDAAAAGGAGGSGGSDLYEGGDFFQ